MKALHGVSPRIEARVAGALYIFSMLLGVAGPILIGHKMQLQGDWANMGAAILYTGVTVLFWDLFRPISEWLSACIAIFSLIANWLPQSWYKAAHTSIFLYFGLYCLLISYLIFRSHFLPKFVGVSMACAGVCWLTTTWPWLGSAIAPYNGLVGLLGEGGLAGYLVIVGLSERRWREQAELS